MWLRVNPHSSVPMYQQIVDGVKEAVAVGIVQPGERLLPVRDLAAELAINHNTVAKAYQELEREHVIELTRGRGTFISSPQHTPDSASREDELLAMMNKLFVEAHHLRVSEDKLIQLFRDTLNKWRGTRGEGAHHGSGNRDITSDENL
jgi:GntR family transcriptional regulator